MYKELISYGKVSGTYKELILNLINKEKTGFEQFIDSW